MRVIFLDIDGVLNFDTSPRIDRRRLFLVKYIVRRTGAVLVLSSSWRDAVLYPQCLEPADAAFVDHLMYHSGLPFVGVTPDIDWAHRELEIQKWLEMADESIEAFVIIDDLEFDFPRVFPKNFVQTSGFLKRGLTWSQAVKAIKILNHSV